jgi:hypothetical protein
VSGSTFRYQSQFQSQYTDNFEAPTTSKSTKIYLAVLELLQVNRRTDGHGVANRHNFAIFKLQEWQKFVGYMCFAYVFIYFTSLHKTSVEFLHRLSVKKGRGYVISGFCCGVNEISLFWDATQIRSTVINDVLGQPIGSHFQGTSSSRPPLVYGTR